MSCLTVATKNPGKLREIREILGSEARLLSLADFPDVGDIVEDGRTFEANAIKKALAVASQTGHVSLADDSGLEVDALDGAPGVYSARFAGEKATDEQNNRKLLRLLEDVPDAQRTARFRCVIAVGAPDGSVQTAEGTAEGRILHSPRGTGGFGYDPLFLVSGLRRTFAELPSEEKNRISHRGNALRSAYSMLSQFL
ncbi:MAG: XTP/dITP diphosphatase [Gemmatimonadota bacterium]|nr:XTP/dITP diphosphatase [Gemmatimonadota bacterium]